MVYLSDLIPGQSGTIVWIQRNAEPSVAEFLTHGDRITKLSGNGTNGVIVIDHDCIHRTLAMSLCEQIGVLV